MSFVHLHTHTEYSPLDGAIKISDMVEKAQEFIEEWKLPSKTAEWLNKKIEAKIGSEERK